jgi:metal-responsive CopG/Arc/MetJ family transcriptional regulator
MKTAISLPDELFDELEKLGRQMAKRRSELYRLALEDYLLRHDVDRVRDAMNAALDKIEGSDSGFANAAASRTLEDTEW